MNKLLYAGYFVFIVATTCIAGADDPPHLSVHEEWGAVFGDQEVVYHVDLAAGRHPFQGRIVWRLSAAGRPLAQGERDVDLPSGRAETVAVHMPIPPVNPGVVLPLNMVVEAVRRGEQRADVELRLPLWVFSEDPFHARKQWVESQRLHLFDPIGTTTEHFESAGLTWTPVHNINALEGIERGVIIIGEGLSLRTYRALPEIMINLAAAGRRVICLAPVDGEWVLADSELKMGADRIVLRRSDIIAEWDKRLDAVAWPPDGRVASAGLTLTGDRGRVLGVVDEGGEWPWLDVHYPNGGRLIFCGFAIMEKWATGPTPRFFFARILDVLDDDGKGKPDNEGTAP